MEFTKIADNLWQASGSIRMLGIRLDARMTAIKIGDDVVLLSPLPAAKSWKAKACEIGNVAALISPNSFHHLGLPEAVEAFGQVPCFGGPQVQKKRSDVVWQGNHQDWNQTPWGQAFVSYPMQGSGKLDEAVFWHAESKTLILGDLLMQIGEASWAMRWFWKFEGIWRKPGFSKMLSWFVDRKTLAASFAPLLDLKPERVLMCHGDGVVGDDAHQALLRAQEYLLR